MALETARTSDIVREYASFIDKLLQDKLELTQKYDNLIVKVKELHDIITRKDEVIIKFYNFSQNLGNNNTRKTFIKLYRTRIKI